MKIGYLTYHNPKNRLTQSGVHYSMFNALKDDETEVVHIGKTLMPMSAKLPWPLSSVACRLGSSPFIDSNISDGKKIAVAFEKELENTDVDLIYTANSPTAFLETDLPLVYRSDLTFRLQCGYYFPCNALSSERRTYLEECEAKKISRADLLVYPSEWAADSAVNDYDAPREKILVVPSGANFENVPPLPHIVKQRGTLPCKLLFLGKNWERKGGDIAVQTAVAMNDLGLKTELVVVGTTPPYDVPRDIVKVVGFLDKNKKRDLDRLHQLFMECHFMHVPTRAEAFGLIFCEACAFGIPVISTLTGGVPSIVENGVNGHLLSLDADGSAYAEIMVNIFTDRAKYGDMVQNARKKYDEKLNWDSWGNTVRDELKKLSRSQG